jgi:glutathione S-transferase
MIVLHTMPQIGWGLLNPSPFCLKVETCLRMRSDAYERAPTLFANRAPRGKLPWIEDGRARVADSERIVRWLERRGDVLGEASVSPAARARGHLVRRAVEESLYFAIVAERWRDPVIRRRYADDLLSSMPRPARVVVARLARLTLERQLWQQGFGRHDLDAVRAMAAEDLAAIANVLGDSAFVTGDSPRAVDASLFGSLANLWHIPIETPLRRALAGHANLVGFVDRMRARFAADVEAVLPG